MPETVREQLLERRGSDTPAVRCGDLTWSWRDYVTGAEAEAAAMIGLLDTERPHHVGVLQGNTPAMLRAMAGAALGGYVLAGINTTRPGRRPLVGEVVHPDPHR